MRTHFQTFWPAVPPVGTPAPGAVAPPMLVLYGAAQLVVVLKPLGMIEAVVVAADRADEDTHVQGIAARGRKRDGVGRGARRRRVVG